MKYVSLIIFIFYANSAVSSELEVGKYYRAKVDFVVFSGQDAPSPVPASVEELTKLTVVEVGAKSKFLVISKNENIYMITFTNIYRLSSNANDSQSQALINQTYYVSRKADFKASADDISDAAPAEGPKSGALVVPFKYRIDDGTTSGEATLGYYAGYSVEFESYWPDGVVLTPFVSAGLTQVSVLAANENDEVNETNKSGVTIAVGAFLNNWDKVNIGLVFGQDRIGDKTWKYEGDTWVSLSVGWEL